MSLSSSSEAKKPHGQLPKESDTNVSIVLTTEGQRNATAMAKCK